MLRVPCIKLECYRWSSIKSTRGLALEETKIRTTKSHVNLSSPRLFCARGWQMEREQMRDRDEGSRALLQCVQRDSSWQCGR